MTNLIQINADGSTEVGEDPPKVPFDDQTEIIKNALIGEGWTIHSYDGNESKKTHSIEIEKSGEKIEAIIYLFTPFNYSAPRSDPSEKRVQLGTPSGTAKAERDHNFALPRDGSPRCALLSIYRRDDLILFGAWVAENYVGHGTNPNIWMKGRLLAAAARTGFARELNARGDILCAFVPSMLPAYLRDMALIHGDALTVDEPDDESDGGPSKISDIAQNNVPDDLPHNRLLYGAPGTGKSHNLDEDIKEHFPDEHLFERVVFHPETTNGVFVGEYRPTPVYRKGDGTLLAADRKTCVENLEPIIDYRFVPGPFLRILARAHNNPEHSFCLVVEEINRAQAAAVFGEVFQMLDRNDEGAGRFTVIFPDEAQNYLASYGIKGAVTLPSNLYLWATMNSADQGVLPLDAAFKRRWSLEYVGLNEGEDVVAGWDMRLRFMDTPIRWNTFRRTINAHLQTLGVAEDRMLGPFFMTQKDLGKFGSFENKILHYLREDVVRSTPGKLFAGELLTYGSLIEAYREGKNIFVPEIELATD